MLAISACDGSSNCIERIPLPASVSSHNTPIPYTTYTDALDLYALGDEHREYCSTSNATGPCNGKSGTAADSCQKQCYDKIINGTYNAAMIFAPGMNSVSDWVTSKITVNDFTALQINIDGDVKVCSEYPLLENTLIGSHNSVRRYVDSIMENESYMAVGGKYNPSGTPTDIIGQWAADKDRFFISTSIDHNNSGSPNPVNVYYNSGGANSTAFSLKNGQVPLLLYGHKNTKSHACDNNDPACTKNDSQKLRFGEQLVLESYNYYDGHAFVGDQISVTINGGPKRYLVDEVGNNNFTNSYDISANHLGNFEGNTLHGQRFIIDYSSLFNDESDHSPQYFTIKNEDDSTPYVVRARTLGCRDQSGRYLQARIKDGASISPVYDMRIWNKRETTTNTANLTGSIKGGTWTPANESGFITGNLQFRVVYIYDSVEKKDGFGENIDDSFYNITDNEHYYGNEGYYKVNITANQIGSGSAASDEGDKASFVASEIVEPIRAMLWGIQIDLGLVNGGLKDADDPGLTMHNDADCATAGMQADNLSITADYAYYEYNDGGGDQCLRAPSGGAGFQIIPRVYNALTGDGGFFSIVSKALLLYIVLFGIYYMLGIGGTRSIYGVVMRLIKFSIIIILLSPDSFSFFKKYFFITFIDGVPQLAQLMVDPVAQTITGTSNSSSFGFYDEIFVTFFSKDTWTKIVSLLFTGWNGGGFIFTGICLIMMMIIGFLIFITVFVKAIIAYLVAFIAIAFLIMVAPLFIVFSLFGFTANMFKHWLDYLISYFMQPLFMFITLIIMTKIVLASLHNVLDFEICWECIWNVDLSVIPSFCLINFWVPTGWSDSNSSYAGIFFTIITFVVLCDVMGRMLEWSLAAAMSVSGAINSNVGSITNEAWNKMGGNRLEAFAFNAPSNFAGGVARTTVSAAKMTALGGVSMLSGGVAGLAGRAGASKVDAGATGLRSMAKKQMNKEYKNQNMFQKAILAPFNVGSFGMSNLPNAASSAATYARSNPKKAAGYALTAPISAPAAALYYGGKAAAGAAKGAATSRSTTERIVHAKRSLSKMGSESYNWLDKNSRTRNDNDKFI
jgi:type IV secretory pathway VirB6-like protein